MELMLAVRKSLVDKLIFSYSVDNWLKGIDVELSQT